VALSKEQSELLEKLVSSDTDAESEIQRFCIERIREFRGEYARLNQVFIQAEQNVNNLRRELQRISDQADKYVDDLFEWRNKERIVVDNEEDKEQEDFAPAPKTEEIVGADGKPVT